MASVIQIIILHNKYTHPFALAIAREKSKKKKSRKKGNRKKFNWMHYQNHCLLKFLSISKYFIDWEIHFENSVIHKN